MAEYFKLERIQADAGVGIDLCVVGDGAPVLSVLAGVHGDELEGIAAVRMLIASLRSVRVIGQLRAVAVCNEPAFASRSRTSPLDGRNLARSFPGRADGDPTERIAQILVESVIRGSSLLVDLHSAGDDFSMPWFAGWVATGDETGRAAETAARAFGAPLIWEHDATGPGRSLSVARDLGVPAIYVEGAGGGALRRQEVIGYFRGVRRLMAARGMIDDDIGESPSPRQMRGGDGNVDLSIASSSAGWCMTNVQAGDSVGCGDLLAEILDVEGEVVEQITAPASGTVMLVRRRADIEIGDAVAMLGPLASEVS